MTMFQWKDVQGLVPAAGGTPDLAACLEAFPQLRLAATTPQDPVFHASDP